MTDYQRTMNEELRATVRRLAAIAAIGAATWATACGDSAPRGRNGRARDAAPPVESTTARTAAATAPASPAAHVDRTGAPRALFLGTSLTAGLGLADPATESWPAVIQERADSEQVPLAVVNAGLSGETSAGALRRADWLLKEPYALVVIETGANDGLRGLDPDTTAANIARIIAKVRAANRDVQVVLVQMEAPTSLGPRYTAAFHALFGRVASRERVALTPFLLDHVGGIPRLNQADGIHPTAEGARLAAANVWPTIRSALRTAPATTR